MTAGIFISRCGAVNFARGPEISRRTSRLTFRFSKPGTESSLWRGLGVTADPSLGGCALAEGSVEVGYQIVGVLDPNAQTDESIRNLHPRARQARVSHLPRVLDQRLDATK